MNPSNTLNQGPKKETEFLAGRTPKFLQTTLLSALFFLLLGVGESWGQSTVTVGTGTTSSYIPFTTYYNCVLSEQIYLNTELNTGGPVSISSISFYSGDLSTASNSSSAIRIWMKSTSSTSFTSAEVSYSGYYLVYDGTYTISANEGWKSITLQTPYNYDGANNLQILVEKSAGYASPYRYFNGHTTSTKMNRYYVADLYALNTIQGISGTQSSLTAGTLRPNIQIAYTLTNSASSPLTYYSSTTWTAPAGVCSVNVECFGGGGAGGTEVSHASNRASGGGGGGAYASTSNITVSPGTSYTITVGEGGKPSFTASSTGGNGGNSSFESNVIAAGGSGGSGAGNGPGGAGGVTTTPTVSSNTPRAGGAGATGVNGTAGGGGGSSAGTSVIGNAGSGSTAGSAPAGGVAGGAGGTSTFGTNGSIGGGGGGGARQSGGVTPWIGGIGGSGKVTISWSTPSVSATPVVSSICAGATSISGTSSEANNTSIELFSGSTSLGTTTVTSGAWTKSGLTALASGASITAKATASCKTVSAASTAVVVSAISATPAITGTYCAGATTVSGTGVNGSTIKVIVGGSEIQSGSATWTSTSWSITVSSLSGGNSITATQTESGKCVSAASTSVITGSPPTVSSFSPSSGCANGQLVLTGTNLSTVTAVSVNGTAVSSFTINSGTQITATLAVTTSSGTVSVTNPCGTATSSSNYTVYSIGWANTQSPASGSICPSGTFDVYGQIYAENLTNASGAGTGIVAQLGYSTSNTNPNTWTNWVSTTFNTQSGNNDEYKGTLSGLTAGTYYYAFRYTLGTGCSYTYGGTAGIWNNDNGTLTVNANHAIALSSAAGTTAQTICVNNALTAITYTLSGGATGASVTGLPTGVTASVSGTTLTISGTPSVAGSYSYTVTTTGNSCTTASASGTITVGGTINWANLQSPASGTICSSGTFTAYGQVYQAGVTEAAGQGSGITVQLGYSTSNTDPSTWTNWVATTFNVQSGNNDEYMGTLSGLSAGTYYYAFRYKLTASIACGYQYGGYNGGFWNGTSNVNGVLTINAGPTFTATPTNPLCNGGTGSISIVASNGASPYQYSKDNGTTWQTGSSFTGLVAGAYLIVVKGSDGCTSAASSTTVSNPTALTASVSSATLRGCSGNTVSLGGSASGGTGTLSYSWSPTTGLSSSSAASPSLTVTGSQTYTLSVTDANGCTSNQPTVAVSIGGSSKYWFGLGSTMGGATTSNNFNLASNWSASSSSFVATQVPESCDDVYYTTVNGNSILTANATVKSLTISHSGGGNVFSLNTGAYTFEVLNATAITVTSGNLSTDLRLNCNSGTFIFNGDFVSSGAYACPVFSTTAGSGVIIYRGNVTYGTSTYVYSANLPQKVIFDGASSQSLNTNSGSAIFMPTLQIGGYTSNSPVVTIGGTTTNGIRPNDLAVYSTLVIPSSGLTNDFGVLRNAAGGSFNLYAGALLKLGGVNLGGSTTLGANNFPQNYTTITLHATSTVEYYGGTQTVYATPTYGHLTLSTSGNKTAGGALTVAGNLLINSPATFAAGTSLTHNLAGNFTNNGTFTSTTGTINFNTAGSKTISGSSTTAFQTLILNKGTNITNILDITGAGAVTASTLTLTNGLLRVSTGGSFTSNNTIAIGSTTGIEVNGGTYSSNGSVTNGGLFKLTSGTANMGSTDSHTFSNAASSTFTMLAGAMNVSSRMDFTGANTAGTFSGGTLTLNTVGNSTTIPSLDIQGAANITMSSTATLAFQLANTSTGGDLKITSGAGTKSFSGGTVQFGNASTAASSTFSCNSGVTLNNVTINSTNSPKVKLVTNNLTVAGTLTMNGGNIDGATNSLTTIVTNSATTAVVRTAGYVNYKLKRAISTTGADYLWPVGFSTNYTPATYNFTNLTAGDLEVLAVTGQEPNLASSSIDNTKGVGMYWTTTPTSAVSTDYSGNYAWPSGLNVGTVSAGSFQYGKFNASTSVWAYPTISGTPTTTTLAFTGANGLITNHAIGNCRPPTTATNSSTQSICTTTTSITNLGGNNPTVGVGTWSVVSGPSTLSTQFGDVNTYDTSFTPAEGAGSYVIRWTIDLASPAACSNPSSADATITVDPTSVGGTIAGSATVCSGTNSTTLTLSGHTGTVTKWQSSTSSTFASSVTDIANTTTSLTASNLTTTTYYRAVVTSGVCSAANSATATVTVNQPSVAPTSISGTTTICNNQSTTLTANGGAVGTGANYQWGTGSIVGSSIISGATASTLSVSPTSTTTYWVRITNGTSPCSATTDGVTATVTVNQPSVAPTAITGTTTICNGSSTTLTANGTLGTGANYQWGTGSVVGTNPIAGETSATLTVSPTSTTTYWVRITNSTAPCTATTSGVTTLVTVNQPSVAPTSISGTTTICNGANTTLTAVGGTLGTGATYEWGTGSTVGTNAIAGTGSSITVSPTSDTTYWVRITNGTSPCSASTDGVTATVTVNPTTTITAQSTAAQSVCNGAGFSPISVTATGTGTLTYQWYSNTSASNTGGTSLSPNGQSATYTPSSSTDGTKYYYCIVTGTCGSATSVVSGAFEVNPLPNSPTAISYNCSGDAVLTATAGTGETVAWYTYNSNTQAYTIVAANATNTATLTIAPNPGSYFAFSTSNGCMSEFGTETPVEISPVNKYTGGANGLSTDWFTAGNWTCGLPNATTNVVIPTGKIVSISYASGHAPAEAGTVTLEGTGKLTVTTGCSIVVTDNVNVASGASFTLENKASLVQVNSVIANVGSIKVKKATENLGYDDCVFWSSPVQNVAMSTFAPNSNNFYWTFNSAVVNNSNSSSASYSWVGVAPNAPFETGKGYYIKSPNTQQTNTPWTTEFNGTPNNGNIELVYPVTGDITERYYFVGNPYPSAISIDAFMEANAAYINKTIYLFREPNGNPGTGYSTVNKNPENVISFQSNGSGVNPSGVIPSGQGFLVRLLPTATTYKVVFNNTMRVSTSHGQFNRLATSTEDAFNLKLTAANARFSQTKVGYYENALNEEEASFDVRSMDDGAFDLGTLLNQKNFKVQARAAYNAADVIPLRFKTNISGEHRIALSDTNGVFAADQMVIIKDNLTGVQHNLTANGDYVFTSATGTFTNRFEVIYQQAYYTALQANSCGATIANMSSLVYADIVNGATGYRFKVVNNTTAAVQTIDRPQHWFAFNMLSAYDYNTPYTISVQVQKDGVWTGYYGATCTVNSPNIAATGVMQINPSQCGMTLPTIGTVIATTPVAGATGYKFRITNTTAGAMGNNLVQEVTRTNHWFTLAMLARYNYGSSYAIEVAVKTTGGYTPYGNACTVYAPAVPTLASCGQTVATATTLVRTTATNLATQYRFQVTRIATQETITFDTANYWFSFRVNVPGYAAGEQYGVRVAVMTAGAWSPYGDACDITAPIATARTTEEAAPSEANLFKPVAYPNPFKSEFSIALATPFQDDVTLVVYDLQGRLIEKQTVPVSLIDTIHIGANYQMGDYMLVVSQGPAIESMLLHKE